MFLAVGASSLIVGLAGIQLSPLTTVSGPLMIASCTEFSVLILGRYLEERQDGLASRDASNTAAARTGRAFFTSAATTIGGFAVLMISSLPLLRDFWLIVTLNVAIGLLAALVVMPPIMVWVDDRGWLGIDPQVDPNRSVRLAAPMPGDQTALAGVGLVAILAAGVGVYAAADTSQGAADGSRTPRSHSRPRRPPPRPSHPRRCRRRRYPPRRRRRWKAGRHHRRRRPGRRSTRRSSPTWHPPVRSRRLCSLCSATPCSRQCRALHDRDVV